MNDRIRVIIFHVFGAFLLLLGLWNCFDFVRLYSRFHYITDLDDGLRHSQGFLGLILVVYSYNLLCKKEWAFKAVSIVLLILAVFPLLFGVGMWVSYGAWPIFLMSIMPSLLFILMYRFFDDKQTAKLFKPPENDKNS